MQKRRVLVLFGSKSLKLRELLPKKGAKERQRHGKRGRRGDEHGVRRRGTGPLSQQATRSCLAMSPCHRHGNHQPAESFGLIGSCQGNDKINVVFDGNIVRWA